MDFTLTKYQNLLKALQYKGFVFQTFADFLKQPSEKAVILRHDVDKLPGNALKMAKLEHSMGINGTYFFRTVKTVWNEQIIRQIAGFGHEIAYHYENLSAAKGNYEKAILNFEENLTRIRKICPVKTICMHGSPLSKHENTDLWTKYDYRSYGIIGEPYFDVDYKEVFYMTDTGRKWNNERSNVRDKVKSGFDISIKSTSHIIKLAHANKLPDKIIINTHPHRWFNFGFGWVNELIMQNFKNIAKRIIVYAK